MTKGYRVRETTAEAQTILLQCCASRKFHVIDGQNKRDQIMSDRRSKTCDQIVFCAFNSF